MTATATIIVGCPYCGVDITGHVGPLRTTPTRPAHLRLKCGACHSWAKLVFRVNRGGLSNAEKGAREAQAAAVRAEKEALWRDPACSCRLVKCAGGYAHSHLCSAWEG